MTCDVNVPQVLLSTSTCRVTCFHWVVHNLHECVDASAFLIAPFTCVLDVVVVSLTFHFGYEICFSFGESDTRLIECFCCTFLIYITFSVKEVVKRIDESSQGEVNCVGCSGSKWTCVSSTFVLELEISVTSCVRLSEKLIELNSVSLAA